MFESLKSPLDELTNALLTEKRLRLYIKREDLIHPAVSGNKWRKLKYNLIEAKKQNKNTLLTFGGAFSNHIYATAAAGKHFGFATIGIIRGEESSFGNPTLSFARNCGMELKAVSRTAYRNKKELIKEFSNASTYFIPEGGTNQLALKGVTELLSEIPFFEENANRTTLITSVGTGGTIAGLIKGAKGHAEIMGFASLKGNFLEKEIKELLSAEASQYDNWSIQNDFHFGGYAKFDKNLIQFINDFKRDYNIQLEPIYTGKMMYGLFDLIQNDFFEKGQTLIALHTGGLQGIKGFNLMHGDLIF